MTMSRLAATLDAFHEVEEALTAELARTLVSRDQLRRLQPAALLQRASDREAFSHHLERLLGAAQASLEQLCLAVGVGAGVEALTRRDAALGAQVTQAITGAKRAARALKDADEHDRAVSERALIVVRALAGRLPVHGAAYGRHGAAPLPSAATTTRRTA